MSASAGGVIASGQPIRDDANWMAARLRSAMQTIADRGVEVKHQGRLHEALKVLDSLAASGVNPTDVGSRRRIATATRLSLDLGDVASMVPDSISGEEREALDRVQF